MTCGCTTLQGPTWLPRPAYSAKGRRRAKGGLQVIRFDLFATMQVYLDVEAVAAELKELVHDADSNGALCSLLEKVRLTPSLLFADLRCSKHVSTGYAHACVTSRLLS
jgi:hypothetical protein